MMLRRLAPLFSITSHAEVLGVLIVVLSVAVLSAASAMKNGGWILQEPFIELASPVAMSAAGETRVGRPHYSPRTVESSVMDEVDHYLWGVCERSPTKRDSTGDFTWKDASAALRLGMSLETYVIGGMDPDLRESLYRAGLAMDAAGIHWTILSAFRDDYRQSLVSGFKAHTDNSSMGGVSRLAGHGALSTSRTQMVIPTLSGNGSTRTAQELVFNVYYFTLIRRTFQPRGAWHELAVALRNYRLGSGTVAGETVTVNAPTASTATLSDRESACVKLRHWEGDSLQAKISTSPMGG
jgi:hypothetical protein